MKISRACLLAAAAAAALAAQARAAEGLVVGGGRDEAVHLWRSGVTAVLNGQNKMAEALWQRCLQASPADEDCRAGLVLLGHAELRAKADTTPLPAPEQALKKDAKAVIPGQTDKGNALKNWKAGAKFFQTGDLRQAHDAWTRCLELDPGNAECADGLERIEASGAVTGQKKAPGKAAAERLYGEGMRHFMGKRLEQARAAWEECLKQDPANEDCAAGLKRLE